jgi:hypothetical protein
MPLVLRLNEGLGRSRRTLLDGKRSDMFDPASDDTCERSLLGL